jgi:hypothetical protein
METADIDLNSVGEKRCTAHVFLPHRPHLLVGFDPGSPVHISDTDFPPDILFDAAYAGAVLHHFGTQELKDAVTESWKAILYPVTSAHADSKAAAERRQSRAEERQARYEARRSPDTFDMLMTLPYVMVPKNKLQAVLREAEEKVEAAERSRVQDKVDSWMRQVTTT